MRAQAGFTLIEMMIVVAIVGLLATVGFPAYNDYVIRSKLVEGMNAINFLKPTLIENATVNVGKALWTGMDGASIVSPVVTQVDISGTNGVMTVYLTAQGVTGTLLMAPIESTVDQPLSWLGPAPRNPVYWVCVAAGVTRNGISGATLPAKYAPRICR